MTTKELDDILKLCSYNPNLLSIEVATDENGNIIRVQLNLPYARLSFTKDKHPDLHKEVRKWINKVIAIRGNEIHGVPP